MPVNYTKLPFSGIQNAQAPTLTEAITAPPVSDGFIVLAIKLLQPDDTYIEKIRAFAQALRAKSEALGFIEITAYRQMKQTELGGAVPFDQAICETMIRDGSKRVRADSSLHPALKPALKMSDTNDLADWTILIQFKTVGDASEAVASREKDDAYQMMVRETKKVSIGAFENRNQYGHVSRDPDVIQFFNYFPGPGDVDQLWQGWQDALPWFFETGEMRSSFPLASVDPNHSVLIVNYAHFDSIKHFFLGVAYDPNYTETVKSSYTDRGFSLPLPFFCKIVPV